MSEFCAYFHRACAETAIYELPVKNLTPPFAPATSISYKTDVFHYWVTFTGYIRYSCATTSHDLVTLTFWPWEWFMYSASHVRPTYQFWLSYDYRLLSYAEYWSHFRYLKVTAHAPCHVTYHRGGNSPHFWNSSPQFAYSLCRFQGAATKIKPCYWWK